MSKDNESRGIVYPPDVVSVPRRTIVDAVHYLGLSTDPDVIQVIADLANVILDATAEPGGVCARCGSKIAQFDDRTWCSCGHKAAAEPARKDQ